MIVNLRRYVNSIIFKYTASPCYVDFDFWDNLKIIDVLED